MIGRLGRAAIYAYCEPADLRKGFEGLAGLVREALAMDPLSGSLFLFTNRRRTLAKILWFDGSGVCVLAKRIEKGRFANFAAYAARTTLPLKRTELDLFLEGSDLIGRFQVSPPNLREEDLAISDRK